MYPLGARGCCTLKYFSGKTTASPRPDPADISPYIYEYRYILNLVHAVDVITTAYRVHVDWKWPLSRLRSVAQLAEGGSESPPPFTLSPTATRDILPLEPLPANLARDSYLYSRIIAPFSLCYYPWNKKSHDSQRIKKRVGPLTKQLHFHSSMPAREREREKEEEEVQQIYSASNSTSTLK